MATIGISKPTFKTAGTFEPLRLSNPVGAGALFDEGDFVTISPYFAAPVANGTIVNPPASIDAIMLNSGGTIAAGSYAIAIGYVNANGSTPIGPVVVGTTTGTGSLTVYSPPASGDATGYRLYVSAVNSFGTLFLQGATVNIGTNATLVAPPATVTASPTTNTTGLAAPTIPTVAGSGTTGPGARTEYYVVTYVNANGETAASPEQTVVLTAGQIATVTSPAASGDASGYNVYGALASGQEQKQNSTPIAIGTNWVEPTTGLIVPGVQRCIVNQPATSAYGLPLILGLADHDYNATYGGFVGGAQTGGLTPFGRPVWNTRRYGAQQQYSGISTEPANAHTISAQYVDFAINIINLTNGWDPGLIQQQVGLNIDPGSGFFVADPTQTNKVATIVGTVDGPNWGGPGDVNKRILIKFLPAAIVPA
jgi:hypothetical protein